MEKGKRLTGVSLMEWGEREAMGDEYDESNDIIEINCLSEPS